jgi:hypothetical protein
MSGEVLVYYQQARCTWPAAGWTNPPDTFLLALGSG